MVGAEEGARGGGAGCGGRETGEVFKDIEGRKVGRGMEEGGRWVATVNKAFFLDRGSHT